MGCSTRRNGSNTSPRISRVTTPSSGSASPGRPRMPKLRKMDPDRRSVSSEDCAEARGYATLAPSVISILIVSFNTAPELVACLESLARCTAALPHEIIVVDNGSTDGSVEAVRKRFPAVQLVTNQENLGFSKASNQML